MLYDIVNMSDSYTIEANSLEVAAVACLFLGRGQYAFKPLEKGGVEIPFFMLGGADEWFQENFQKTMDAVVSDVVGNRTVELADCFDSCLIGKLTDREIATMTQQALNDPAKYAEWREKYHDKRCSSLNDIGGRAYKMAANFRTQAAPQIEAAPTQVFAI